MSVRSDDGGSGEATRTLARFAASLDHDAVPERVREYCKTLLLDAFACAFAGYQGEQTSQVSALAAALGDSRASSVIGGAPLSLCGATMLNGFLVTAVTMCEVHLPTLAHTSPGVIAPALAIAEREDRNGRELLTALIAGYEVATRVGIGLDYPAFRKRGWHSDGVLGPFGGAAAAGHLLRLDSSRMAMAFGIAGSQAAGTFAAWGTPTMKFHQARGAVSGLFAALLAAEGFGATEEFLTAGDGGLYHAYSNGGKPQSALEGLGARWELEQIAMRLWPTASLTLGAVTALFDLVEAHDIAPEEVEKITVTISAAAHGLHGGLDRYQGKFQALLSTHYAAAAIVHDRALSLTQFTAARFDDPAMRSFAADKVEVRADPAFRESEARVEIELVGRPRVAMRCDAPRGTPRNPLSRADIEHKFREYAHERLDRARAEEVVAQVGRLDESVSVRRLLALLSLRS